MLAFLNFNVKVKQDINLLGKTQGRAPHQIELHTYASIGEHFCSNVALS